MRTDYAPEGLLPERYPAGSFRWAAPGDRQYDAWMIRFDDQERGDVVFSAGTYDDPEAAAWEAWSRYAPAWNCRVFRTAELTGSASPALQPAIAEGFVAVPLKPTTDMVESGQRASEANWGCFPDEAVAIYRAMLAAAPASPQPPMRVPTRQEVDATAIRIHNARYGDDYPPHLFVPFHLEDRQGQEYCRRLARAALLSSDRAETGS